MGSTQSSEPVASVTRPDSSSSPAPTSSRSQMALDHSESKPEKPVLVIEKNRNEVRNLSGMDLINHKCRRRKRVYDKCVSDHYNNFIGGRSNEQQEDVCGDKYDNWRQCVLKGIRKEFWERDGLPPPKEGSYLSEIKDDQEE